MISGNAISGLLIQGSSNVVSGNIIGLNAAGTAALANGGDGIQIAGARTPQSVVRPQTNATLSVVICKDGIWIYGGSSNTTVLGNYIGLNAAGTAAIGNQTYSGIWIDAA